MNTQSIFRTAVAAMLLTSSLLFTQCQGPQGEPGPQGEKGATGDTGATGPKGETGTANVIQVTWQKASDRTDRSSPKYILPSGITLKNSFVAVYITVNSVWWLPLPYDYTSGISAEYLGHYNFFFRESENVIYLRARRLNATGNIDNVYDVGMRAIIVPASILRNGRYSAEFWQDYKTVQKAFNLPD
ncbi:hypothetical protein DR864_13350 [Runella rosea]|uniref:Collagen-like protein n=1 Tax=Runella rosea TaxID=2259595 RepID=A0A344TJ47_9BACT|nr:collagen-like protein [Runella rosea]AXE18668.1 hypothetical protein DR864_13350 [Runella rosea]